ncbi:MAG: phytanoyl-CoA dioxygenase family protein [Chitinophagaceae bacterium]
MKKITQPAFQLEQAVTEEHTAFFHKHGVIQFKNFISRETVNDFLNEIKSVESFLFKNNIQKVNGVPLKFGKDTDGSTIIQRLAFTSQYSEELSKFLQSKRLKSLTKLLDPYEGRISENEKDGLVVNHYINTTTSGFSQLGWHTDSPRDLFLGSRIMPMLNVGLHLDDCPTSNGGLRVLAGTHNKGLFTLFFKKKYFIDNKPDKNETGLEIEAGDLTIHDGRIWHRVQQSPYVGELSRRRVMYIPIITGAYKPKHANSSTPFYHRLAQLKLNPYGGRSARKEEQKQEAGNFIPELNLNS